MKILPRLLRFRRELVALWAAFLSPATPVWLKAAMLLVPAYLLSPVDLIPDFIPFAGWLDDMVIVPMLVSWIFGMLPKAQPSARAYRPSGTDRNAPVINGTYRRR